MRGRILFNGNIRADRDYVYAARDLLLDSRHQDPRIADSRKVLLITAAWGEREHDEGHIKKALTEIGIPSRFVAGFDRNIENLSAFHAYREFCRLEPRLAADWAERESLIESGRDLYLEKNNFYTGQLRRTIAELKERNPGRSLARVMADVTGTLRHSPARFDGSRLLSTFLEEDIRDTIDRLVANDDRMVRLLSELDEQFVDGTGLHYNPTWLRLRGDLADRILSANSLFLFGGNLAELHRCLNFFRLREPLMEALRLGTTFLSVSAGSLLLCERIIIYNDFESSREFQLFDRGFGLVRHLQLFPHCMDRIQTDDPNNLSYLAHRFQNRTCVGLNQDSFLLMEGDPELVCTSIGSRDGVYVFDPSGAKRCYLQGERLLTN
ncbi:MAG: Type 1 glutamine amidotransferase-like domain-containing protein [Vulcanimicrobiota bacterium]